MYLAAAENELGLALNKIWSQGAGAVKRGSVAQAPNEALVKEMQEELSNRTARLGRTCIFAGRDGQSNETQVLDCISDDREITNMLVSRNKSELSQSCVNMWTFASKIDSSQILFGC